MLWTVFKDLRIDEDESGKRKIITPEEVETFIFSTPLQGLGMDLVRVAYQNRVNPIYLLAHIIHETGWGKSKIFSEKKNLFGFGACDRNPLEKALSFDSPAKCLGKVVKYIAREYLHEKGKFYAGPNLMGMNHHYASDRSWCYKIVSLMNQIEKFLSGKRKEKSCS